MAIEGSFSKVNWSSEPPRTIYAVVKWIRETSETEKEKGDRFERASRYFLMNDPLWKAKFKNVWLWKDAPTNDGKDLGIDLVAEDAEDGTLWAIQCKCYQKDTLDYTDVATFYGLTGADSQVYAHNMVITTCKQFGPNLDKIAEKWETIRVFVDNMDEAGIDWQPFAEGKEDAGKRALYEPRKHQREAIDDCLKGFTEHDRGKLIMACGTGKTLTALRLTEELMGAGGNILFLAPSIALTGQSMRAWVAQAKLPMRVFVVCSDEKASATDEDLWESSLKDLPYPATTDAELLAKQVKGGSNPGGLTVIFSTYQSIQVVSDAQKLGVDPFDLIVCDEAHRTTGMSEAGKSKEEISQFVKVHDNTIVSARKRLYMTATPRIYGDKAKMHAKEDSYEVASMDDEATFGPEFHWLSFGSAVDNGLLTDYRVLALTVSEDVVSEVYQRVMAGEDGFEIPDAAKIIGCWKGLLNQGGTSVGDVMSFADGDLPPAGEGRPLQNAVAFCSTIAESKRIADYFERTVDAYIAYERDVKGAEMPDYHCEVHHVDGSMNAKVRKAEIEWLAEDDGDEMGCRMLSNAKCLSEGIDVPSLDAVMFLQPKKSQIDIIQAVGRVMRRFEGKKFGYIILPVVIPSGMTPTEALDDNEAYAAVWQVLKALRSHDERLDARINALPYDRPGNEEPGGKKEHLGEDEDPDDPSKDDQKGFQESLALEYTAQQFQEGVRAVIVKKCGTKIYWDLWARDIAEIAKRHIQRIGEIVKHEPEAQERFEMFLEGLRDSLNESITADQAVEMLAQHVITLPVFEVLFGGGFATSNPVSVAMEDMIEVIRRFQLETPEERRELEGLYASVRMRAEGVKTDAGRQQIIKDLYENFFRYAFKQTSEAMGVVYTPHQVVSYILHFTNRMLQKEFGQTFADEGVHILDPFTGTGTFVVDLIEDESLIPVEALPYKYAHEIHCNEILLLAYYIATINIEAAYHNRMVEAATVTGGPGGDAQSLKQSSLRCGTRFVGNPARLEVAYTPFEGAVLTDTFQMYEAGDPIDVGMFVDNTERVLKQMETPVKVVIGNPPYSAGQKNANDNAQNERYPTLDKKIAKTYVAQTNAILRSALYDSYVRAFRWASDRIGNRGIITFVSNAGWLDGSSFDGFRKCITEEFSSIYVLNLRGNQRTKGEQSRREGGKIFGSGSRAPIAITTLIKNPDSEERGVIHYHDIGDYLTRDEKLSILAANKDGGGLSWKIIQPDKYGDWLNQRDESYEQFAPVSISKRKEPRGLFDMWSGGVKTQRDAWAWNYSCGKLESNMMALVSNTNSEIERVAGNVDEITYDASRFSWTRAMRSMVAKRECIEFDTRRVVSALYRPFCKQYLYLDRQMNEVISLMPTLFPAGKDNLFIAVTAGDNYSCLMANMVADYHFVGDPQCFPLYWYETDEGVGGMFASEGGVKRHDGITDEALSVFRSAYPAAYAGRTQTNGGPQVTKEDIFYYIYGVLHSPEYRSRFQSNLSKELPRIPLASDFRAFAEAGRALAGLHLNYEAVEKYPLDIVGDEENAGPVQKMKWGKRTDPATKKKVDDDTVLIYNKNLTFKGIPEAADRYVVNGRTPLEWMIDRYQVKTDKASGIVNDPNEYSEDPMYIIDLVKRLVTVSVRTTEIVDSLPPLSERPQTANWPFAWGRVERDERGEVERQTEQVAEQIAAAPAPKPKKRKGKPNGTESMFPLDE